jgi:hypothetical protein
VFAPLAVGPTDLDTTRRIAAFFEPRLAADPGSLWPEELRRLAQLPRLAQPAAS